MTGSPLQGSGYSRGPRSGRGSTRAGVPAALPGGSYEPPGAVAAGAGSLVVDFRGEDGRGRSFDVSVLPLPDWNRLLADSWAARIGPTGRLRTAASVEGAWNGLGHFMRFLATLPQPPARPENLEVEHVDAYRRFREVTMPPLLTSRALQAIGHTFDCPPIRDLIAPEVRDRLRTRARGRPTPISGYSEGEFKRLVAAAREDVAALRERLEGADASKASEELDGRRHDEMLRTVQLADLGVSAVESEATLRALADKAFVMREDVIAMQVLLVALTGWNVEVIKDLPVEHRIIDGLAVELEVTKRRRGAGHWHRTVAWEIGPAGRELHTPGGLYLLLHRLMAPGRALMDNQAFWAVWHAGRSGLGMGVRNPFEHRLSGNFKTSDWEALQHLLADSPSDPTDVERKPTPLRLNFNRLKTTVDVQRTRRMGGHLPSAARTNTIPVLFSNYLAGDQSTAEWARGLVADTLLEVEQTAWENHRRALNASGRNTLRVVASTAHDDHASTAPSADPPVDDTNSRTAGSYAPGADETAWTTCLDHEHHPITGHRCTSSFLDCFNCSNCLIADTHLPRLLALLDALDQRRGAMADADWWRRYGPTWTAIRYEVLPKFTEPALAQARTDQPDDSLLDLVEPGWEQP